MFNFITLDRKKFTINNFQELIDATEKIFKGHDQSVARSLMLLTLGQACKAHLNSNKDKDGIKQNFFRIFGNMYYVSSENGFNNALYDLVQGRGYSKEAVRRMAQGYPVKYPALLSLTDETFEAARIQVQWVPLVNLNGSDLPPGKSRRVCHFCVKSVAKKEGCCINRGSMWIRYSSKTKNWSIECPETNDYSIINVCPMCGRNLHED